MIATQAVIVSVAASQWGSAAYSAPIWETARCPIGTSASDGSSGDGKGEDDLVITPGGPRPRRQVHEVRPGETLRQNDDGTFTIVPSDVPADPKPASKEPDDN